MTFRPQFCEPDKIPNTKVKKLIMKIIKNLKKSLNEKRKAISLLLKYKTLAVGFYEYVLTPKNVHANDNNLLRIHGFGLSKLGGRHQYVRVVNVDSGKSFNAKAMGAGPAYQLKSPKSVILNYNQRSYLGLDKDVRNANIAIHPVKTEEQIRREEFRYMKYGLILTAIGVFYAILA
jgi:hypothetical protein